MQSILTNRAVEILRHAQAAGDVDSTIQKALRINLEEPIFGDDLLTWEEPVIESPPEPPVREDP
jgi:hypothetical protein